MTLVLSYTCAQSKTLFSFPFTGRDALESRLVLALSYYTHVNVNVYLIATHLLYLVVAKQTEICYLKLRVLVK